MALAHTDMHVVGDQLAGVARGVNFRIKLVCMKILLVLGVNNSYIQEDIW